MLAVTLVAFCSCKQSNEDAGSAVKLFGAVPESAYAGDEVSLWGDGFGDAVTSVTVGGIEAEVVRVMSDNVVITIPAGAKSGPIVLTSAAGSATLNNFRVLADAEIVSFAPAEVTYDGKVVIYGYGFDLNNVFNNTVTVVSNGAQSPPLRVLSGGFNTDMQMDSLQVFVSEAFSNTGGAHLMVKAGASIAKAERIITFKANPRIDNIYPRRGGAGTVITIEGMNFDTETITNNTVMCGTQPLTVIAVSSRSKMTVKLPDVLANGYGLEGMISVSVPSGDAPAVSTTTFRYDPAVDFSFGDYGIVYVNAAATTVGITQAYVDQMLAMGVKYVTFRLVPASTSTGLVDGSLPTALIALDNAIKAKQMSGGKLKTIVVIDQPTTAGAATPASAAAFFDKIEAYSIADYPGVTAWQCIDAFQIFYNANATGTLALTSLVNDFYVPVWKRLHPNGYPCKGEKLIVAMHRVLNGTNFNYQDLKAAHFLEYIDVLNGQWNYGGTTGGTVNFSKDCPANGFISSFTSMSGVVNSSASDGYPICFMTAECNINAANAKFQTTTSLQAAFIYLINEMKKVPGYKGWTYRSFLEDNVGMHAGNGNADPYLGGTPPSPTHEQMYKNVVTGTGGTLQ